MVIAGTCINQDVLKDVLSRRFRTAVVKIEPWTNYIIKDYNPAPDTFTQEYWLPYENEFRNGGGSNNIDHPLCFGQVGATIEDLGATLKTVYEHGVFLKNATKVLPLSYQSEEVKFFEYYDGDGYNVPIPTYPASDDFNAYNKQAYMSGTSINVISYVDATGAYNIRQMLSFDGFLVWFR